MSDVEVRKAVIDNIKSWILWDFDVQRKLIAYELTVLFRQLSNYLTLQPVIIHRIVSFLEKMRNSKDTKKQDQDKDEKVNDKEPGMQREGFRHDSPSGKMQLRPV